MTAVAQRDRALAKAHQANRRRRAAERKRRHGELLRTVSSSTSALGRAQRRYDQALERAVRTGKPEHFDRADQLQSEVLQLGVRIRQAKAKLREFNQ